MSVLIKDMEMPKNCGECPFIFTSWGIEYYCHLAKSSTSAEYVGREKMTNCPLIELPPHGRLIDADKIDFRNYDMHDGKGNLIVDNNFINGIVWANDCIDRTPTVIEAEGEKDGR